MSDLFTSSVKHSAQEAAYAAVKHIKFKSTAVIEYQSQGRVLLIATAASVEQLGDFPEPLTVEVFLLDKLAPGEAVSIDGALGNFRVQAGKRAFLADLVLDMSVPSILSMALKPPGYVWLGPELDSAAAITELSDLVGVFNKPRYFAYDSSICAHDRSGKKGCTRCIDACPAQAISSLGEAIEVDAYRCHGGGICATVCPSGAMTYAYPGAEDLLNHVRGLILAYRNAGGGAPALAFVNEEQHQRVLHGLPGCLIVCVEEVASVGPEIWLSALAWGARTVQLFDLDRMPESSRKALDLQLNMLSEMLNAMALPAGVVSVIADMNELISINAMPHIEAATHAAVDQKRQAFYMALDHLVAQVEEVKPVVSLPAGSIFGEAMVVAERCTLCMSCVSACPANALRDGKETPQLRFVESHCLQCGICTSTCPEDAMTIAPRLLLDREARNETRVLYEESPFHCISCGKAFATTSGISTILSRLAGHSMFADERAQSRLKMCSDCRVKDMMVDPAVDL